MKLLDLLPWATGLTYDASTIVLYYRTLTTYMHLLLFTRQKAWVENLAPWLLSSAGVRLFCRNQHNAEVEVKMDAEGRAHSRQSAIGEAQHRPSRFMPSFMWICMFCLR